MHEMFHLLLQKIIIINYSMYENQQTYEWNMNV